jgi:glutamate formiminotransferase/formiminotetrahydrofolate cyclodeaminase
VAEKGQAIKDELLFLVDEDTHSFNLIMEAFGLPKKTDEEKAARTQAIQDATKYAIEIPYRTLCKSFEVFEVCQKMVEIGNPNSVTDAAVGILCARAACIGAFMNMQINCASLNDKEFVKDILDKGRDIVGKADKIEKEFTARVLAQINE